MDSDDDDSVRWSNTPQQDYLGGYGRFNGIQNGWATLEGEGNSCNNYNNSVKFSYTSGIFVR